MFRKNKPSRLNKKISNKQKFDDWLYTSLPYLMFFVFIFVTIFFVYFVIMFMPGNDSAIVYNWGI